MSGTSVVFARDLKLDYGDIGTITGVLALAWGGAALLMAGKLFKRGDDEAEDDDTPIALDAATFAPKLLRLEKALESYPGDVTVRYRQGGEILRPHGDRHTRALRDLFQQAAVPPWVRPRMPLIEAGGRLVAVADKWLTEEGKTLFDRVGGTPVWHRDD